MIGNTDMLLTFGSTGEDVKWLQAQLGSGIDGVFGTETETMLKVWQRAHGLVADGIVGNATWARLQADAHGVAAGAPTGTSGKPDLLRLHGLIPETVLLALSATMDKFCINTSLRLAHFLAQCAQESADFSVVNENLNYSAAELLKEFPKYFDAASAAAYADRPHAIASRVYANRMGNGNEASCDGYTFRGRGYIQLTGKTNYTTLSKCIGVDIIVQPDLVSTDYAMMSAAFFFQTHDLWEICDTGASNAVVTELTRRVNGGKNGLSERISRFDKYYAQLGSDAA